MNKSIAPQRGTILLLALIAALSSLATQLLVPALPLMALDLRSGADDAQLVVSVYLVGVGMGQLLAGPFADRIGRKPVLLTGLAVYCLASLCAALAPSLPLLLTARLFQALGGAAGVVISRVLIGDLYASNDAAAKQAALMSVVLISPAFAPVIGGYLSELAGWRNLFGMLALAGLMGAMLSFKLLPETRQRRSSADNLSLRASFARLAVNPKFLRPTLSIIGGTAALYMYLGTAPFLLADEYNLCPREVGLCLMLVAGTSILGTFMVAPIERRSDAMRLGSLLCFASALAMLVLALIDWTSLPSLLAPSVLLGLGAGMAGPSGVARIIAAEKGLEGTATSLSGAAQMLISAVATILLSRFAPISHLELAIALLIATGIGVSAVLPQNSVNAKAFRH
jgi:MFS transporter, DHA1 family, multidrug resistance protein